MKVIVFTAVILLAFTSTGTANDCNNLWPYVMEAKDDMVKGFMEYKMKMVESEAGNLIFWDSYIQIQCGGEDATKTPLHWLGEMNKNGEMNPYKAGFLLWLENLKRYENLDIA